MDIGDIPEYAWTMFEEVDCLRDTVDSAGELEMSSDIRGTRSVLTDIRIGQRLKAEGVDGLHA